MGEKRMMSSSISTPSLSSPSLWEGETSTTSTPGNSLLMTTTTIGPSNNGTAKKNTMSPLLSSSSTTMSSTTIAKTTSKLIKITSQQPALQLLEQRKQNSQQRNKEGKSRKKHHQQHQQDLQNQHQHDRKQQQEATLDSSSSTSSRSSFSSLMHEHKEQQDDELHRMNKATSTSSRHINDLVESHTVATDADTDTDSDTGTVVGYSNNNTNVSLMGKDCKSRAIRWITCANAFHFASYECSRIGTMALLTSTRTGFQSASSSISLATGFVSPFSIFILWKYSHLLDMNGPRKSLLYSTLLLGIILVTVGMVLELLDPYFQIHDNNDNVNKNSITSRIRFHEISRMLLFSMYIIKNSFVQLLYSQHWSFITSVFSSSSSSSLSSNDDETTSTIISKPTTSLPTDACTCTTGSTSNTKHKRECCCYNKQIVSSSASASSSANTSASASTWFPIISGVASISATISAWGMSQPYVQRILYLTSSLHRLLLVAAVLMFACAYCSDQAYRIAEQNNFVPSDTKKIKDVNGTKEESTKISSTIRTQQNQKHQSIYQRAKELFQRVPILQGLCIEVIVCQSVSSVLSFLFVSTSQKCFINDDQARSKFTGNVYASINLGSGLLEFLVLPLTLKYIQSKHLWLFMPSLVFGLVCWIVQSSSSPSFPPGTVQQPFPTKNHLNLVAVTASYATMKIIEYSLRSVAAEMVYTTLDYESRYFGKEIVSLVANRFGKSGTAIGLALVSMNHPEYFDTKTAPLALLTLTALWLVASNKIVTLSKRSSSSSQKVTKAKKDM